MKSLGIILIIAGLLLFVFSRIKANAEERILQTSYPTGIHVKEITTPEWPAFAGLGFSGLGLLYVAIGKRKLPLTV